MLSAAVCHCVTLVQRGNVCDKRKGRHAFRGLPAVELNKRAQRTLARLLDQLDWDQTTPVGLSVDSLRPPEVSVEKNANVPQRLPARQKYALNPIAVNNNLDLDKHHARAYRPNSNALHTRPSYASPMGKENQIHSLPKYTIC